MDKDILFYDVKDKFGEFSNYYPHKQQLVIAGARYRTVEHWFQAAKFSVHGASSASIEYSELIRNAKTPNIARVLAVQKTGGGYKWRTALNEPIRASLEAGVRLREDWEEVKDDVMLEGLRAKYHQDQHCASVLLSTGNSKLIEHTKRDRYWADGGDGSGKSRLGALLMQVRSEIREEKDRGSRGERGREHSSRHEEMKEGEKKEQRKGKEVARSKAKQEEVREKKMQGEHELTAGKKRKPCTQQSRLSEQDGKTHERTTREERANSPVENREPKDDGRQLKKRKRGEHASTVPQ